MSLPPLSERLGGTDTLFPYEITGVSPKFAGFAERISIPEAAEIFTPRTPCVYVSAEFGFPGFGYTGGLGVLARDHMASLTEIEADAVGIGLRYTQRNQQVVRSIPGGGFIQIDNPIPLQPPKDLDMEFQEGIHVRVHGEKGSKTIPVFRFPLGGEHAKLYLLDDVGQVYPVEQRIAPDYGMTQFWVLADIRLLDS